jgi:hypothetical protein
MGKLATHNWKAATTAGIIPQKFHKKEPKKRVFQRAFQGRGQPLIVPINSTL